MHDQNIEVRVQSSVSSAVGEPFERRSKKSGGSLHRVSTVWLQRLDALTVK